MGKISINTTQKVIPMIYAYSTPEIARHDGWVKIGYTEKQTTEQRQKQQSHTVDVEYYYNQTIQYQYSNIFSTAENNLEAV